MDFTEDAWILTLQENLSIPFNSTIIYIRRVFIMEWVYGICAAVAAVIILFLVAFWVVKKFGIRIDKRLRISVGSKSVTIESERKIL